MMKTVSEQLAIANANPLRYRGYYYDTETGYYYLQSRYYDASICRFINADIPEIAQVSKSISAGTNLFAYCNNEPINNSDPDGKIAVSAAFGAIMGAMFGMLGYILEIIVDNISYLIRNVRKIFSTIKNKIRIGDLIFNAAKGALNGVLSTVLNLKQLLE